MIYTVTLNPARDRSVTIPDFAAGKVNRISAVRDDPGGKGINVSKVILALGGCSVAMGILGGGTGEYIRRCLDEMRIENDFVTGKNETRTNIKISDPVNHETTDINEKGVIDADEAEAVLQRLLSGLCPEDIVVIAGKLDTSKLDLCRWIRKISDAGALTFLDTEGEALKAGVEAGPYLIKPNDLELSQLLGREVGGKEDCLEAARKLIREKGIHTVVISLGSEGALFVTEKKACRCPGIPVEAVSTVGAGDTMMAALAFCKSEGQSFEDACRLSVAASAAAVTCMGTESPTVKQIEELLPKAELEVIE